jgi:hypothetical protein
MRLFDTGKMHDAEKKAYHLPLIVRQPFYAIIAFRKIRFISICIACSGAFVTKSDLSKPSFLRCTTILLLEWSFGSI